MNTKKRFYSSSNSEAPKKISAYNVQNDPGYQESVAFLAGLKKQMKKASHKMTAAEIMATIPGLQQNLINQQKYAPTAAPGANWGAVNNRVNAPAQQQFTPTYAPQYQGGLFNGPQSVDPASLQSPAQNFTYLAGLLGAPSQGGK